MKPSEVNKCQRTAGTSFDVFSLDGLPDLDIATSLSFSPFLVHIISIEEFDNSITVIGIGVQAFWGKVKHHSLLEASWHLEASIAASHKQRHCTGS
jgi:hypothetical protein